MQKRVLVICVDRDDDLREKAKVSGPVIGRKANLEAAMKLAVADPEDPDSNGIFEAVKIYDSVSKEKKAEVVTITGNRRLGYSADKEVSRQLDRVLKEFPAESCIFVSDGADDEEVVPIISSRIKIDSKRLVVMKQAKELEKTYFVLLEKLKEPYYARIILGIPALLILGLALSEYLGFGWKPVAMVLGGYLLLKGFGVEDNLLSWLEDFKISSDRISFIIYLAALPLVLVSIWLGLQAYATTTLSNMDEVKVAAYTLRNILLLLPWAALLIIFGKVLDLLREGRRYETLNYGLQVVTVALLWMIFSVAANWVIADAYFSDFVSAIIASIAIAFVAVELMKALRVRVASSMRLENKEVLSEVGAYIGKIVGVDRKKGMLIVQTSLGQRLQYAIDKISSIDDKVVVKS